MIIIAGTMIDSNPIKSSDIVFLGDSLTEWFDLEKHFERNDIRNRGMAGNLTDHVLYRLEEILNTKPRILFLMIGINDLLQDKKPIDVYKNTRKIINQLQEHCPATKLYIQSVLPINEDRMLMDLSLNNEIYKLNHLLESFARENNLTFIDLHSEFLNSTGQMNTKYTFDGVHLSERGYELWSSLLRDYID